MRGKVYFISGIDTNIGKTYATGMLSKALLDTGKEVVTQKIIQTGCKEISEDLVLHRKMEKRDYVEEDMLGWTAPYIFNYPCSPHMAAEMENCLIDPSTLTKYTEKLRERYEYVLVEGAGGLMVPLNMDTLTIDYIKANDYPVLLVTSGRLGSINHTLLSLFACKQYGIEVKALLYNMFPPTDRLITDNTLEYFKYYLNKEFKNTEIIILPEASTGKLKGIEYLL